MKILKIRQFIAQSNYYGKIIFLIGLIIAVPIVVLPFYPEEAYLAYTFLLPSGAAVALGIVVCIVTPNTSKKITEWQSPLQKGSLPVLFAWLLGIFLGAIPLVLSGHLDFIHALFESVGGWSTTGLAIIDVTDWPHIMLFHRSFMQYCGGLGFIMMIVMFIKGKQAMNLYTAEGHPDKLMPSLKKTAQMIFLLYNGFLVVGATLYIIFGMSAFDSICHSMSALSTAGFTTQYGGISSFDNLAIELVTVFLMLIGSTNFAALMLLCRGKLRQFFRISEVRFFLGLLVVFIPLISLSLIFEMGWGVGSSLRNALFAVVSFISTTGYYITDYFQWPPFAMGLMIILMFIGGGMGSTSGGIKLSRASLLLLITRESIRKRMSPERNVRRLNYYRAQGKTAIDSKIIIDTLGFISCYILIVVVGALLITITADCSLSDAMFEFLSVFSTLGISNGLTNINTNTATLIIEMIGMILGRLEIFIVFIGIYSFVQSARKKVAKVIGRIHLFKSDGEG